MSRKIFIIHQSEIIRRGLAGIIRSYFNAEVTQIEESAFLSGFCELKNYEIIIIDENRNLHQNRYFQILSKKNRVKWIAFLNCSDDSIVPLPFCNFFITPQTSSTLIQRMISRCLDLPRQQPRNPLSEELTPREKDVLRLVAQGHSNKNIADMLFISIHTVISHRKNITEKTGIRSISGLTVYAILNNLIDTSTINPEELI